jgi:hypothetical protein
MLTVRIAEHLHPLPAEMRIDGDKKPSPVFRFSPDIPLVMGDNLFDEC